MSETACALNVENVKFRGRTQANARKHAQYERESQLRSCFFQPVVCVLKRMDFGICVTRVHAHTIDL